MNPYIRFIYFHPMVPPSIARDPYYRKLRSSRIGVLMGGRSAERDVSLRSGRGVLSALSRMGFDAVAVDAAYGLEKKLASERIQTAFIALHGRWGEDGTVQGLLEYMDIPYTGSGVHASALAMNKVTSKQVFACHGMPTAPWFTIHAEGRWEDKIPARPMPGFPFIVKPVNEGSSVGCHIVRTRAELIKAVRLEQRRYPRLFAERFLRGRELTVGVLDRGRGPEALPVLELAPKRDFYDYQAKYTEGLTDFLLPAPLTPAQTRRVQTLALRAHDALNCHGYSRTDFILEKKRGVPYVLELNTLPGLTALSDIPAQARAAGLTYDELIYWILRSAHSARRSLRRAVYD